MGRLRIWMIAAAVGQLGLSVAAALLSCEGCRKGPNLGWLGAGYYAVVTVAALLPNPSLYSLLARFAFALHVALGFAMLRTGAWCVLCVAALAGAAHLLVVAAVADQRTLLRFAFELVPLSLVAAASVSPLSLREPPPGPTEELTVTVYELPMCPYCRILRTEILPSIAREFGDRLRVRFESADAADFVSIAPTLVLSGPRGSKVLEGLPDPEALRRELAAIR